MRCLRCRPEFSTPVVVHVRFAERQLEQGTFLSQRVYKIILISINILCPARIVAAYFASTTLVALFRICRSR